MTKKKKIILAVSAGAASLAGAFTLGVVICAKVYKAFFKLFFR